MKIKVRVLIMFLLFTLSAKADVLKLFGKEKYGYNQPKYEQIYKLEKNDFTLVTLVDDNNFPLSSEEQGSIFSKIFLDMLEAINAKIIFVYDKNNYKERVAEFERGNEDNINARLGVYYEEYPYSKNEYIYPAFYENKIHIIMSSDNVLPLQGKSSLKEYKGAYVKTDKLPKHITRELSALGMSAVENLSEAFQKLLTGKIDYIAASYYSSAIESYKLGIRRNIIFSKSPVWKIAMFLRTTPQIAQHPQINKIQKYFKSERYKKVRDEAFKELMKIYEENTKGIVSPLYINNTSETEKNEKQTEDNKGL